MEQISVFDIIKIGIGPSSSHTMGPWRAAQRFLGVLEADGGLERTASLRVTLYGSLAKTGKGHGTGFALILGLSGADPVTVDTAAMHETVAAVRRDHRLPLGGRREIAFDPAERFVYRMDEALDFHSNGLTFEAELDDGTTRTETYFSIGGGFVVQAGEEDGEDAPAARLPHPIASGADLIRHCRTLDASIAEVVRANERTWRTDAEIDDGLRRIWDVMKACLYRGCHTEGRLPGGLDVKRRAAEMNRKRLPPGVEPGVTYADPDGWLAAVRCLTPSFNDVLKWVSLFAIAANEENAAFGRVVTAPTNGASGVIPAVLAYYLCFVDGATEDDVVPFLLTAGEVGSIFKKGATISAAMGGCQAEIGVSSAMAAAALTACSGGTPAQALMAAEIAMEHHLGMTCDPIGGLVQIPCIERNSMGAVKAITAANLALDSDPETAKVSLDAVVQTMWETAQGMHARYKETAEGGLALQIPVNIIEC